MLSVCLYFHLHQPYRLRRYTFFDIGKDHFYEDENLNCDILINTARHSYLPLNALLEKAIKQSEGKLKVAFSISGTALDQCAEWAPEVIESFKTLTKTGCVEFVSELEDHSLAFLFSRNEFERQVKVHDERIFKLFGQKPAVFRNTELIYNNDLAKAVEGMGYKAVMTEGIEHVLGWRTPNFVYQPSECLDLKLLLNNRQMVDDVNYNFSNSHWDQYPLTPEKFASWISECAKTDSDECLNLDFDYETFGINQPANTGIFDFMRELPKCILAHPELEFKTPSQLADTIDPMAKLDVPLYISSAEGEHNLVEWLGNDMQNDAIEALYALESRVIKLGNPDLTKVWRHLQTAEHFWYMSTKWFSDEGVRPVRNHYGSPYDAYINYMNVLADFELSLRDAENMAKSEKCDSASAK